MKKNRVMFFGAATVGVVAIFVFFGAMMSVSVPHARAYAVGSVPADAGAGAGTSSSYDAGNSFQNLVSPFTGFFNSLKFNNDTTININGVNNAVGGAGFSWPTVNVAPVLESTVQNTLSQWFSQFDNWVYGATGIQLSGIMVAILGVFSWALGLAQQAVNWLLGLFH
jgi:hypothetical protein